MSDAPTPASPAGEPPRVRVTLIVVRAREVLLGDASAETGGRHALPSAELAHGQSIAACARELAAAVGLASLGGVELQLVGNFLSDGGEHTLRVALLVAVPPATTPAVGWAFHPADAPPAPLDPASAAALEACRAGRRIVDLGGESWPADGASPATRGRSAARRERAPLSAPKPPSLLASGLELAGALCWLGAIFLVLDERRLWRGTFAGLVWLALSVAAWRAAARTGRSLRPAGRAGALARWLGVLLVGAVTSLAIATLLGFAAASLPAEAAYFFLGALGIPTFLFARWRARRRLPENATVRLAPRLARAFGWALLVGLTAVFLVTPLANRVERAARARWNAVVAVGAPDD